MSKGINTIRKGFFIMHEMTCQIEDNMSVTQEEERKTYYHNLYLVEVKHRNIFLSKVGGIVNLSK
ncbi:hypothetical protein SBF1_9220002 [Candidatus Desulfosporosinus infrequens]|uniref:Uncharacterized protein n=1 Tax=Candidatus Desulfosporosinus infrequens TaxID=2043169 RepID=A0A2U3LX79_9FIRM|nr:hypothetical protein SBF1_9220002 [Candidatus Desulfosporosinus infrequens]